MLHIVVIDVEPSHELIDAYQFVGRHERKVGFDIDATIGWRCEAALDETLPLAARAEHDQMAAWLMELKNLRTLL